MEAFNTGTLAGAGSFKCDECGFAVALQERDAVPYCPNCGGGRFARASLFSTVEEAGPTLDVDGAPDWLGEAREALVAGGAYLAYQDGGRPVVISLEEGWTRVGRSLAAHVRLDDPTVSRRHALVYRDENEIRVLDDRSLNGVFVNGQRAELAELSDGDEIAVGRFRLYFLDLDGTRPRGRSGIGSAVSLTR